MRIRSLIVGILFCSTAMPMLGAAPPVDEQDFPRPIMPDFVAGFMTMHETIGVAVTFDAEGRVQSCDARYGSSEVRQKTCDSIMRTWQSLPFAGKTVFAYINYGQAGPVHVTLHPPPPYPHDLWKRGEEGLVVVVITFDEEGHVKSCRVRNASAPKELADSTCDFITRYWEANAYAGKTVEVPFTFERPR